MDIKTAREILNVNKNTSMDEIRRKYRYLAKRYHPDIPETGNAKRFMLYSAAYVTLQANDIGLEENSLMQDDLSSAFSLKTAIHSHVNEARDEYLNSLDYIESETLHRLQRTIKRCNSRSDLKRAIKKTIPKILNSANAQLNVNSKRLSQDIGKSNSDYLFEVFRAMYRENRKYWLIDIYKNKVMILGVFSEVAVYALTFVPSVYLKLPDLSRIVSSLALIYVIPVITSAVLLYQYIMLNPRRQFIPPSLSTSETHSIISEQNNNITYTITEGAIGGAIGGIFASGLLISSIPIWKYPCCTVWQKN